jgi:hypothetical protein
MHHLLMTLWVYQYLSVIAIGPPHLLGVQLSKPRQLLQSATLHLSPLLP